MNAQQVSHARIQFDTFQSAKGKVEVLIKGDVFLNWVSLKWELLDLLQTIHNEQNLHFVFETTHPDKVTELLLNLSRIPSNVPEFNTWLVHWAMGYSHPKNVTVCH